MKRITTMVRSYAAVAMLALILVAGCAPAAPAASAPEATVPADIDSDIYTPVSLPAEGELRGVADVVAKVKPSVVAISTETTGVDIFNRPLTQQGAGSGWIIRDDGYVVTNNHVVENASSVLVMLDDGRSYEALAVYTDVLTDLAVVKIGVSGLPAADIGDSASLRIGDAVVAIGNSLGMGISATSGIASAVGVSLASSPGQTLLELVQTDAAINPGNSGGPLVNARGEVIGINSIKIAQIGVEGMGYSITINQALPVIHDLIENGRVIRPWLGVGMTTVNSFMTSRYELPVQSGVLVTEVVAGSPADDVGLVPGDIIVVFASRNITGVQDFTRAISLLAVGDQAVIVFWRGEKKETRIATLEATPPA
jgi:serine protease Do